MYLLDCQVLPLTSSSYAQLTPAAVKLEIVDDTQTFDYRTSIEWTCKGKAATSQSVLREQRRMLLKMLSNENCRYEKKIEYALYLLIKTVVTNRAVWEKGWIRSLPVKQNGTNKQGRERDIGKAFRRRIGCWAQSTLFVNAISMNDLTSSFSMSLRLQIIKIHLNKIRRTETKIISQRVLTNGGGHLITAAFTSIVAQWQRRLLKSSPEPSRAKCDEDKC